MPVRIELPVPFPLATVNAWLFPGRQPALLDCGVGTPASLQQLLDGVRGAGVDPRALQLFLTHGHVDHAGNAAALHAQFDVPVVAPKSESPYVETFRKDGPRRNDEFADALATHGMPEADVARLRQGSDAVDAFLDDVPLAREPHRVQETFGDLSMQVLPTPGHTPGSTCYVHEDNFILTGDTLLETITSNAVELRDADHGNYHRYTQSVASLRPFVGMDALPGHRDPFRLTDAVIDHHLDHHRKRQAKLLRAMAQPISAYRLMKTVFPHWTSDAQLFMGMAEVVGHLHSMELAGLAQKKDVDGRRRYVAT